MMDFMLFLRYFTYLLMFFPTALYAVLPLREPMRFPAVKTCSLLFSGTAIIALLLSILGAITGFNAKSLFALGLLPQFLLFFALSGGRPVKKIYLFLNSCMVTMNSIVLGVLISAPLELGNDSAVLGFVSSGICLGVAAVLGLIYFKTLTVKIPYLLKTEALDLNWRFAVLIPAAVTLLFYWVTPRSAEVVMTGRVRTTTIAFLMLGPMVFLLIYHVFWKMGVNLVENARLRAENELMEMESKRYAELRAYMDETRTLRHDFRQHMLAIEEYARSGENEKLTEYIGSLAPSLADRRGRYAQNSVVDAVAAHYDRVAQDADIHVKWKIELPEKIPIADSDFVAIFGNLVENAINATAGLSAEKKSIQVNVKMFSDEMLGISVKNPYSGTIKLRKNGLPRSSRAEGGVGLSSVSAIVHHYGGTLDINTDYGIFTVGVLLYTK